VGSGGNAFGAMFDGFVRGMQEAEAARARAARRAAEQRRRAELERRRRAEQRRRERIRRAARMRVDWDRREAEMSRRLDGVFDVVLGPRGTPFFGTGGSEPAEPWLDSSVVDLRPEPGEQERLERRLRAGGTGYGAVALPAEARILTGQIDPAFLRAQQQRAAATDAFATANYWSQMPARWGSSEADPSIMGALRGLGKVMAGSVRDKAIGWLGPGPERAWTIYSAETGFAGDLKKVVSPATARALMRSEGLDGIGAATDKAQVDLLRNLTGDPSMQHESYQTAFRTLGRAVQVKARRLLTGWGG